MPEKLEQIKYKSSQIKSVKYAVSSESTELQLAVALAVVWFSVSCARTLTRILFSCCFYSIINCFIFLVTIAVKVNLYYSVTITVTVNCHLFFSYFSVSVAVTVN